MRRLTSCSRARSCGCNKADDGAAAESAESAALFAFAFVASVCALRTTGDGNTSRCAPADDADDDEFAAAAEATGTVGASSAIRYATRAGTILGARSSARPMRRFREPNCSTMIFS